MIVTRVPANAGGVALTPALTLADAKRHLDVLHADDDTLIELLCDVARAHLEGADGTGGVLGKAVTRHVVDVTLPAFAGPVIELPQPPLVSVTSVKYRDGADVEQTLPASTYHVIAAPYRPRIELRSGKSWPATFDRPDAVVVRCLIGPDVVPSDLLHAIKLHVGHLYLNREIALDKTLIPMPMGYSALIGPHRTHGWL